MTFKGKTTIEGRIVEIRGGEKRISRAYTYGYMSLTVRVGIYMYSVLVSASKINSYGFLPRIGHYIRAEGIRSPSQDGYHDYSMSHLSSLEHIEPEIKPRK
jgi:hypothetical protein